MRVLSFTPIDTSSIFTPQILVQNQTQTNYDAA
jgi:hypothetical protein